jgi:hypoxanthine phosphoribosyltransferase
MAGGVTGVFSDLNRVLLDAETIQRRVAELAKRIERDLAGETLTVIAIMDGGLFFVADLLRGIDLPIRLHTVSASSYHGGTQTSGQVRLPWPPGLNVTGQHVLLLDDILDTGLTLGAVQDKITEQKPASLHTGVLPAEYVGFEIEDEFVVGYGMDYDGRFRNLPCIGILKLS